MSLKWRFRVTFADRLGPRTYLSPDIRHSDPGWGTELFSAPISRIEVFLPTDHTIVMEGMAEYNYFVEAVQGMSMAGTRIIAFWFCGRLSEGGLVDMWRIGGGRVVHERRPYGREWGGGETRGWKRGAEGRPSSSIVRTAS